MIGASMCTPRPDPSTWNLDEGEDKDGRDPSLLLEVNKFRRFILSFSGVLFDEEVSLKSESWRFRLVRDFDFDIWFCVER